MAVASKDTGVIIQSWVGPQLAADLKRVADAERRSVSAVIRLALQDKLDESKRTSS